MMKKSCFLLLIMLFGAAVSGFCSDAKVLVVVPDAFVRNALVARLQINGYHYIRTEACEKIESGYIAALFGEFRPDYVIVDGSKKDATDTMLIDTQVINAAYNVNIKKVVVLAPFELYPPKCPLPFKEDVLLDIKRESLTNPNHIAKITALKQCHEYNGLKRPRFLFCPHPYLCGPHDTGFDAKSSHPVKNIAARLVKAKWQNESFAVISNDGRARYELLHVDDLAEAAVFLLTAPADDEVINIAYGRDTNIKTIAEYAKNHLKFSGSLIFDCTSFDDVARLMLDNSRLTTLGWSPTVYSQDIIKDTVLWLENQVKQPYNGSDETPFILP